MFYFIGTGKRVKDLVISCWFVRSNSSPGVFVSSVRGRIRATPVRVEAERTASTLKTGSKTMGRSPMFSLTSSIWPR